MLVHISHILRLAIVFRGIVSASASHRISPIDGSIIALPTQPQLDFQDKEFGLLIHFDIATSIGLDGCNGFPHLVPDVSKFNPTQLDVEQWIDSIQAVGAKYATLVVKHNCGFATFDTKVSFPLTDGHTMLYNYTIEQSPVGGKDIARLFADGMQRRGLSHGYYYSLNFNNFCNVASNALNTDPPTAGQVNITQQTYNDIVYQQLSEVWSNYGHLTEIWMDGGFRDDQKEKLRDLLAEHANTSVVFNGCTTDGFCVTPNSARWIGNEDGTSPNITWSSGVSNDGGNATSPIFCPAVSDSTIQTGDHWFYLPGNDIHSLPELVNSYRTTIGRNTNWELSLSPNASGLIPEDHVARYKELGDFIRKCYGREVAQPRSVDCSVPGVYHAIYAEPVPFNNVQLMEDQSNGQLIREYEILVRTVGSPDEWIVISSGQSIGHKAIAYGFGTVEVTELVINATKYVDEPVWRSVTLHLCDEPK